jgi:hypothetical protein
MAMRSLPIDYRRDAVGDVWPEEIKLLSVRASGAAITLTKCASLACSL